MNFRDSTAALAVLMRDPTAPAVYAVSPRKRLVDIIAFEAWLAGRAIPRTEAA